MAQIPQVPLTVSVDPLHLTVLSVPTAHTCNSPLLAGPELLELHYAAYAELEVPGSFCCPRDTLSLRPTGMGAYTPAPLPRVGRNSENNSHSRAPLLDQAELRLGLRCYFAQ